MNASTFTIGAVSKLTGISTHTLRAWERRHGLAPNARSDSGRRQYTETDIERLSLLKHLTDQGQAISSLANLSFEELQKRSQLNELASLPQQANSHYTLAVLGEFVAPTFFAAKDDLANMQLVSCETSIARFKNDISQHRPQVILMEFEVIDHDAVTLIKQALTLAKPDKALISYTYAHRDELQKLPSTVSLFRHHILTPRFVVDFVTRSVAPKPLPLQTPGNSLQSSEIKPKIFSESQLASLAKITSSVDCECPHHLVGLIRDLSAFEAYSEKCENRDSDDAALHAYLHRTTSSARHAMEIALQKVAKAEGISI